MAYPWRTSKTGTSASLSCTITEPTSAASGDVEFAVFAMGTPTQTITTPSGWTLLFDSGAGAVSRYYIFCVTGGRGGSAPGLVFTISTTTGLEWHSLAFAGATTTADASAAQAIVNGTNPDPPSASASTTTDEAVAFGFNFAGATWTAPTGYTMRSINTGALDCAVASKDLSASGAENPSTFTGPGSTSDIYGVTILYKALTAAAQVPYQPQYLNAPVMAQ